MKKLALIIGVFIVAFAACDKEDSSEDKNIKLYQVESGIVHYTTSISGPNVNGSVTKDLYFKKWGAMEIEFEDKSETSSFFNRSGIEVFTTEYARLANKTDNEKIYVVDYVKKSILTKKHPLIELIRRKDSDAQEAGKQAMIDLGGVQQANEKILGYDCEVWEMIGVKQWIYKGITLKTVSSLAGITIIEVATNIKFDVSVADSYFDLPDFPHKDF